MDRSAYRPLRWVLALVADFTSLLALPPARVGAVDCVVTSNLDDGAGTLRARLADTNCCPISFQAGLGLVTVTPRLVINHTVPVEGAGQVVLYSGAVAANGSVFWIQSGTSVLRGLTIQGGRTNSTWGAGLSITGGNVTLESATVRDNIAANAGGGDIYATNATMHLTNAGGEPLPRVPSAQAPARTP